jgi:HEAT repeat protein
MKDTARTWIAAMLFAAIVPAQNGGAPGGKDATAALARAKVLETQEGDLKAAEQAYRALVSSQDTAVQQEAALRLGSLLWKLDQKDAAKPFLEQAAAMGGDFGAQATAVLQGQSEAALQEQEQLAKARAMLERILELSNPPSDGIVREGLTEAVRDLKWKGKVAAQVIAEALDSLVDTPSPVGVQYSRGQSPGTSMQLQMLWEIGTPPAEALLRRSAASSSVFWRRYVTQNAVKVAPDLVPVFVQFLHDPDPTGEVQRNLRPQLGCIPLEGLEALIRDPDDNAKVAGIEGLTGAWQRMSPEQRRATFSRIREPFRLALRATNSRLFRAAYPLLYAFSAFGPNEARELVLESLAAWPDFADKLPNAKDFFLDDRGLSLLLAAARTLGGNPVGLNDEHGRARDAIAMLVTQHEPAWTAVGINDLLTLIESGYSSQPGTSPRWVTRLIALATPEQLGRLLRATPQMGNINLVLSQFWSIDETRLPKDTYEAARDVIEQCLKLPPAGWQLLQQSPETELRSLLYLVGRSGSAAAPEWLTTLVTRFPNIASCAIETLIQLSFQGVGEPATSALRKFLVWEGSPEKGLDPNRRSQVFAELARLGDVPSIALFPRAYKLGLGNTAPWRPTPGPRTDLMPRPSLASRGIGFLALDGTANGTPGNPLFGYTDPQLVLAWRTLLQSDAREEVWSEIATLQNRIPAAVLPPLAAELPTYVEALSGNNQSDILNIFRPVGAEEVATGTELHAAIQALLRDKNTDLSRLLFFRLQPDVARQFADEARALLRGSKSPGAFGYCFVRAGIEMELADWLLCLQDQEASNRVLTLKSLPQPLPPELRTRVEQMLRTDPSNGVRGEACNLFGRLLSNDAVPPLLDALRNNDESVCKAATDALERIRFFQEQQAYWQNAKAGIDTSPANATAKLLAQARPGEPKDQRLLALRSLGVLGSPESLPYLIDWTKDQDAEIAAAALDAVTTIHRTSAKK